jgi:beta-glucosidase/6-phospho-beta-glucosidase/beta-galactosidase
VEGAWNVDGRLPSIWDDVVHQVPTVIYDGSTGDDAAKSYQYYAEDVKITDILGVRLRNEFQVTSK